MQLCIKPECQSQNSEQAKFCFKCGSKLLLRERYRPIKILGRGGFGKTFVAVDEDIPSKPRCVVKQFYFSNSNPEHFNKAAELFRREATHLDRLGKHPQIPTLLAHFEQEQQLYLVQELIDGLNLEQELQQGVFEPAQIRALLVSLLPVLQFVHEQRVIHRDIKPENIMRRHDHSFVLIDFGIAKLLSDTAVLRQGTEIGSLEYISPEQIRGNAVPASDLYSLGVTCLRLMTGAAPSEIYDVTEDRWQWRRYLSSSDDSALLGQVLDKLLHPAINQRYSSATEALQALSGTPSSIIADTAIASPPQITRSNLGVDYTNLQHLLEAKKWQAADQETWNVMCLATKKAVGTQLDTTDIDQFPCEDLRLINQLWVHYSQGHFGFSVQQQIFESVKRDYIEFCKLIKWQSYNSTTYYQKLQFNRLAPAGHLPSRIWVGGVWLRHASAMAIRLNKCRIF